MAGKTDGIRPPVSCRTCRLGRLTIYGATIATTPDVVNTCRREVCSWPAGRTIVRQGETPSFVYTLYSGWAFGFVVLADGRRQILSFFIPGDILVPDTMMAPGVGLPFAVKS